MFSYRILIVFSPIFYNCFLIEKLLYFHRWFCAENTMKIQAVFLKYCHNTIHRRNLRNIHVVFLSYCHKFFVSWEYNDNPMRIQREFIDDFRWVAFVIGQYLPISPFMRGPFWWFLFDFDDFQRWQGSLTVDILCYRIVWSKSVVK